MGSLKLTSSFVWEKGPLVPHGRWGVKMGGSNGKGEKSGDNGGNMGKDSYNEWPVKELFGSLTQQKLLKIYTSN